MQPKKQSKVQYIGIFEEIDSFYWPKINFLKKGQKIRALVDPPPHSDNARKKTFFFIDVFPNVLLSLPSLLLSLSSFCCHCHLLLSLSILSLSWSSKCMCCCHHHQHPGTWYESYLKIVWMLIMIITIDIIEIIIIPITILVPDKNRTGR